MPSSKSLLNFISSFINQELANFRKQKSAKHIVDVTDY